MCLGQWGAGDRGESGAWSRHLLGAGVSRRWTYLLLHPTLKEHRHTGLNGEGDLPAADHEVLFQGLPEGRLLDPGL